ncbi:hypothetical protein QVD17_09857 [Tagetes erecta]|uniref:Uncharacterized protein n=1 Tax=Tagetes erecta TaxID=13708 RepID=A0AAD8L279_TARER|nr:hypothetical protein QVD17_09857 [Tagetes erecta]
MVKRSEPLRDSINGSDIEIKLQVMLSLHDACTGEIPRTLFKVVLSHLKTLINTCCPTSLTAEIFPFLSHTPTSTHSLSLIKSISFSSLNFPPQYNSQYTNI